MHQLSISIRFFILFLRAITDPRLRATRVPVKNIHAHVHTCMQILYNVYIRKKQKRKHNILPPISVLPCVTSTQVTCAQCGLDGAGNKITHRRHHVSERTQMACTCCSIFSFFVSHVCPSHAKRLVD